MAYNCKKCDSGNLKIDSNYQYHDIYECLDCNYLWHTAIEDCCRNPFLIVAIERYNHDRYSLFHQCLTCGGAFKTRHLRAKEYGEQIRSDFNGSQFDEWKSEKGNESNLIYQSLKTSNYKNSRAYQYHIYLKSEAWKDKKKLVLVRDNYLCQSCKKEAAEDIHHITYINVFHEPLEDLLALCRECHIIIHRSEALQKFLEK